jgi:hypothetical protein
VSPYNLLIPLLFQSVKTLVAIPNWVERGADILGFTAPLEMENATIEGMQLRGQSRKTLADRAVTFQLEFHRAQIIGGPICRIEWRPLSAHSNKGKGPAEWRHILQTGSHCHRFDLNWAESVDGVQRGELPLAVPINEPPDFSSLLALVGKEFRIDGIGSVTAPPWEPTLL